MIKWSRKISIPRNEYDEFKKVLRHLRFDKDYRFTYNLDTNKFEFIFSDRVDDLPWDDIMLLKLVIR